MDQKKDDKKNGEVKILKSIKENKWIYIGVGITTAVILFLILFGDSLPKAFWENIDRFEMLIGVAGAVVSYLAWSNTKKILEQWKGKRVNVSEDDVAIGIDLLQRDANMDEDIEKYFENDKDGKRIIVNGSQINIQEISVGPFTVSPSEKAGRLLLVKSNIPFPCKEEKERSNYMKNYTNIINDLYEVLQKHGVKNIHLFYAGPSALLPFFMIPFINQINIIMYHYGGGRYYQVGMVEK